MKWFTGSIETIFNFLSWVKITFRDEFDAKTILHNSAIEYFSDSRRQTSFPKFFRKKHHKPAFDFFSIQRKINAQKNELKRCFQLVTIRLFCRYLYHNLFLFLVGQIKFSWVGELSLAEHGVLPASLMLPLCKQGLNSDHNHKHEQ